MHWSKNNWQEPHFSKHLEHIELILVQGGSGDSNITPRFHIQNLKPTKAVEKSPKQLKNCKI